MKLGVDCNNTLKELCRKLCKQKNKVGADRCFEGEEVNTIQAEGGEIGSVE